MSSGSSKRMEPPAYRQPVHEILVRLETDPRTGLNRAEALRRLKQHGSNTLKPKASLPEWKKFLNQFRSPLIVLLLVATAISAALWLFERETALPYEALAILAVILLNALLGHVQRSRAEKALAALIRMAAARADVLRDGIPQSILAKDVVPGDILLLEEGDSIVADGRVIESISLQAAEAALTGESLPADKDTAAIPDETSLGDRANMVFSGTSVTYGRGKAVVTATGPQTEIGRIAGMLSTVPDESTPLQKEIDRAARMLGLTVVAIAIIMIATILLVEDVRGFSALFDTLLLGVALAVAAVPEGLPAVVTAVLALGVQRMARRNAIIRHLSAVETLGSANVIASDKTGTLTKNEMTVRRIVTASGSVTFEGSGYSPAGILRQDGGAPITGAIQVELLRTLAAADRANNALLQERNGNWLIQGDPTEGALIVAARKAGLGREALDARFSRVSEIPFSSERKLMSTLHSDAERQEHLLALTKGAPDVLLARCTREQKGDEAIPLTEERRKDILGLNEKLAGEALRTLGIAYRQLPKDGICSEDFDESFEENMIFLGLIGMIDPPRKEAREAVARAKHAGIRPIMITGDHPRTAAVIATELGILDKENVTIGMELENMPERTLDVVVQNTSVYARVNPEHKLRIVRALQRGGAVVAMTGDGVNDAPALKRANIGIAMGLSGTDVSKESADMILADDNFATIIAAVEEGRTIFSNIRKFLRYLLSSNIGEVMTMFFGVLLADVIGLVPDQPGGIVLPLLATQILWVNLVTDGAPALALGVDPADDKVMDMPPRPPGEGVITVRMWIGIALVGLVTAVGTLAVLDAALPGGLIEGSGTLHRGQTLAFTTLILFQIFNVFNARSDERSAFSGMFANHWLWLAIAFSLLLHVAVVYIPYLQKAFSTESLTANDWLQCALVASSVLWLRELSKFILRKIG